MALLLPTRLYRRTLPLPQRPNLPSHNKACHKHNNQLKHHSRHSCLKFHLNPSNRDRCQCGLASQCLGAAGVDVEELTCLLAKEERPVTKPDRVMLAVADVEVHEEVVAA